MGIPENRTSYNPSTMRLSPDLWIYLFHSAYGAAFLPRFLRRSIRVRAAAEEEKPAATARFARGLVVLHMLVLVVLYFGIARAVFSRRPQSLFPPQRWAGAVVLVAAVALATWTLAIFRSWRLRASLAAGHELATDGPFRFVRHPIYLSLDLLALGTLLWLPDPYVAVATAFLALGGDLRARAEEKVLLAVFGDRYRDYSRRVERFVPGMY
jgi:protein-S-isoprenylcysteine O-methyltransferase Ste14